MVRQPAFDPAALVGVAVSRNHWILHRLASLHDGADEGIGAVVVDLSYLSVVAASKGRRESGKGKWWRKALWSEQHMYMAFVK